MEAGFLLKVGEVAKLRQLETMVSLVFQEALSPRTHVCLVM